MTTLSAGAAAGLLVALLVVSTAPESHGATEMQANGPVHPGAAKGFNPQPDPPRVLRAGDGSVRPAGN